MHFPEVLKPSFSLKIYFGEERGKKPCAQLNVQAKSFIFYIWKILQKY